MDDEASFLKDPSVVFMTALLADVKRGVIQLPRFQRGNRWTLQQRLDLLDSVNKGIPIGAIMVWRTKARLATRTKIGPHEIPASDEAGPHQYILDGGQRVGTLLGTLYATPAPSMSSEEVTTDTDSDDQVYEIYYDLKEECFVPRDSREAPPEHWLPLPDALQTVALLKFQRKLRGVTAEVDEWVARADAVATRFRSYKVPVILLGSEDIELATTTFKRVNSTGTRMSDLDMVSALVWSPTFDLAETLERQRDEVLGPLHWESLDDETWLRCIKATLHLDLYASADDVRNSLQRDQGAMDRTADSLKAVAAFLRDVCKIERPSLVPYAHQIPLLVVAFASPSVSARVREKLEAWLWLTTYAGLFGGISGYGLSRAQADLERLVAEERLFWPGRRPFNREPLPRRFDFRHARARALALRLAADHKDGPENLAVYGADAMIQLVTRGRGKESPGNRFFSPVKSRASLLQDLNDSDVRKAHHVSDDAWGAFMRKETEVFVRERTMQLDAMEQDMVGRWSGQIERDDPSFLEHAIDGLTVRASKGPTLQGDPLLRLAKRLQMFRRALVKMDARADAGIIGQVLHAAALGKSELRDRLRVEQAVPLIRARLEKNRPDMVPLAIAVDWDAEHGAARLAITPRLGAATRPVVIDWSLVDSAEYQELHAIELDVRSIGPAPYFVGETDKTKGQEIEVEDAEALWDFLDARGRQPQ